MTQVSVVIPMRNEAPNLAPVVGGILEACAGLDAFEVIVVDDGSTDETATLARDMIVADPRIRLIRHQQSAGQSAAIHSGVLAARAPVICMLDGDGQNPPAELPKLFTPLLDDTTATLAAGSKASAAMRFCRCPISTICTATCPRFSRAKAGTSGMSTCPTANATRAIPNTPTCAARLSACRTCWRWHG